MFINILAQRQRRVREEELKSYCPFSVIFIYTLYSRRQSPKAAAKRESPTTSVGAPYTSEMRSQLDLDLIALRIRGSPYGHTTASVPPSCRGAQMSRTARHQGRFALCADPRPHAPAAAALMAMASPSHCFASARTRPACLERRMMRRTVPRHRVR